MVIEVANTLVASAAVLGSSADGDLAKVALLIHYHVFALAAVDGCRASSVVSHVRVGWVHRRADEKQANVHEQKQAGYKVSKRLPSQREGRSNDAIKHHKKVEYYHPGTNLLQVEWPLPSVASHKAVFKRWHGVSGGQRLAGASRHCLD